MRLAALLLLAWFYGVYFGKLLLQRRQGIRTLQLARGEKPTVLRRQEGALRLVTVLVPLWELAAILGGGQPLPQSLWWVGILLAGAGDVLFTLSVVTMGDSWRAGIPAPGETRLVTGGLYSRSRNPAFFAFDLVYLGIGLLYWCPGLWVVSALGAALFHRQILAEEQFLDDTFGAEYRVYRDRVSRYWGRKGGK